MYTLCVDEVEKIKIPQNEKNFFIIKKSKNYNYSIEIILDLKDSINFINLYLIISAYINDPRFLITSIGCLFKEKGGKHFITENMGARYMKRMNQFDFQDWMLYRINKDWKYNLEEDFYSIIIFFQKELIDIWEKNEKKQFKNLKPKYPWSPILIEKLGKIEQVIINSEKKDLEIEKKNKKIQELEELLKKNKTQPYNKEPKK